MPRGEETAERTVLQIDVVPPVEVQTGDQSERREPCEQVLTPQ
jgi:hypothetical protein